MKLDRVIAVRNSKTVYRDGSHCLKVFNAEYSKSDVLSEALNQARIEETGLNTPKVLEVTRIDGKWAIVSEYIKGKTMAQRMDEAPGKRHELIAQLARLQISVHAKTSPLLPPLQAQLERRILQSGLDEAVRNTLLRRLSEMPAYNAVCHGDFNPSNIIIAENGTPYILDWAHAAQGNASADAAAAYLCFLYRAGAAEAGLYLDAFCAGSHTDRQCIREWLPIAAAARSVRSHENEREFLLTRVLSGNFEE